MKKLIATYLIVLALLTIVITPNTNINVYAGDEDSPPLIGCLYVVTNTPS